MICWLLVHSLEREMVVGATSFLAEEEEIAKHQIVIAGEPQGNNIEVVDMLTNL